MLLLKETIVLMSIRVLWDYRCASATGQFEAEPIREIEAFEEGIDVVDPSLIDRALLQNESENGRIVTKSEASYIINQANDGKPTSLGNPVSSERKRELRMNLGRNQGRVHAMTLEYKKLTKTLDNFEVEFFYQLSKHGKYILAERDTSFLKVLRETHKMIAELADFWVIQWGAQGKHATDFLSPEETLQGIYRYWFPPPNTCASSNSKPAAKSTTKYSVAFNKIQMENKVKTLQEIIKVSMNSCWKQVINKPDKAYHKTLNIDQDTPEENSLAISAERRKYTMTRAPAIEKSFIKNPPTISHSHTEGALVNEEKLPREFLVRFVDGYLSERINSLNIIFDQSQQLFWNTAVSQKARYRAQSWGQKFILQAIQYMFKFGIINEQYLKRFFIQSGAVELTAKHIFQLFQMHSYGFSSYPTFVPEMRYICTHRYTSHLHDILPVLDKKTQCRLMKNTLWYTVDRFDRAFKHFRTQDSVTIHRLFFIGSFQKQLESWPRTPDSSENSASNHYYMLKIVVKKILNYYQKPLLTSPSDEELIKAEYLMIHYFLSYIKTYHKNVNISELLQGDTSINFKIFEKQFETLDAGLGFYQINSILSIPRIFLKVRCTYLPQKFKAEDSRIKSFIKLSRSFKQGITELHKISATNQELRRWIYGEQLDTSERFQNASSGILDILKYELKSLFSYSMFNRRNLWMAKPRTNLYYEYKEPDFFHEAIIIDVDNNKGILPCEDRPF